MRFRRKILTTASEDRLEKLIQERLRPRADKKAIDKRIWDLFGEEWCVMFSDLSGFSRNVEKFGIIHFLQTIHESERLLIPIIDDHDGILLKTEGDSLLVIFRDVDRAIAASVKMQAILRIYNRKKLPEEKEARKAFTKSFLEEVKKDAFLLKIKKEVEDFTSRFPIP